MNRIRFFSQAEATGYGMAGVSYVRGLLAEKIALQWMPMAQIGWDIKPLSGWDAAPLMAMAADDVSLADLPRLIGETSTPIGPAVNIVHSMPENWQYGFQPGGRNIGFTAWEATMLPPHWVPLLNQANAICVPCELNRDIFVNHGISPLVHVVPHMVRSAVNCFTQEEVDEFRKNLGIPANHFVFYTIGTWTVRKNMPGLLSAFCQAFGKDDPVTLVVKTGPKGAEQASYYAAASVPQIASKLLEVEQQKKSKPLPNICLLPYDLSGRGVDMVHAIGDCYLSMSHGEAWGLGAFDAASSGTPVIMTGWGGQQDYLGKTWRGALEYRMKAVPVFPVERPLFWPPQCWAVPEIDAAVKAMRSIVSDSVPWREDAKKTQVEVCQRFSEANVTQRLIEVCKSV